MHDKGCAIGCPWINMQQELLRGRRVGQEASLVCWSCRSVSLGVVGGIEGLSAGLLQAAEQTQGP